LEADVAQLVHRNEIAKADAPIILANQKFAAASLDFLKLLGLFVLSAIVSALFLAGFPLHSYWRPWGPITASVSLFFMILTLMEGVNWIGERSVRNATSKIPRIPHK
jgi:hypothetical protein